ncbi:hypothetical protein RJT34_03161 [Clitoria ternatea]|uniref:Uncharacterized protein n=1 Tax=Clitoria ternatea TaxID=43366 RepID=A0AAN9KMG6_CLITE
MPAIAALSTDSDLIKTTSPTPSDIPIHETLSNELIDGQSMGEPCLLNQQITWRNSSVYALNCFIAGKTFTKLGVAFVLC